MNIMSRTMHVNVSVRVVKTRPNKKGEWPIYYRITIGGSRSETFSGYYVLPTHWEPVSKSIISGHVQYDAIAACVQADQARFLRLYSEYQLVGRSVTSEELINRFKGVQRSVPTLVQALDKLMDEYVLQLGTPGYSKGRFKRYEVFRGKLKSFLSDRMRTKDLELSKLSNQFIIGFDLYLKTEYKLDISTVAVYIKILKRLIRYSISQEWLENDPFAGYRCKLKRVDRPVLSLQELELLEGKSFGTERLTIVRDLFLFCCYTGLSYIDLSKLTPRDIISGVDGKPWLSIHRTKTGEPCRIPLLDKALAIIEKYKDDPESQYKGRLLPVRANQKLNEYLKEIADICGIHKRVTFHVARHTFATTILLNKGVSLETVSKLLGHRNIRTTQIYAKLHDSRIAEEMKSLNAKIKCT